MAGNLKRTIGLGALVGIEIGQSVGAGVFALAGLAMAYTGPSLFLAFLAAAVPVCISMAVLAMLGSALPTTGGTYIYGSRWFSRKAAFLGVWGYILGALLGMFPLYALTGARFLSAVFPMLPEKPVALGLLAFFWVTNLLGVKVAMKVQAVLVGMMFLGLFAYLGAGAGGVDADNFRPLFTGGAGGFLTASAVLTFTILGANSAVELGDEIKDPARNIPRSFIISLPVVVAVYLGIAVVTAGNLGAVGDSPDLADLAARFLSGFPLWFFLIGGGFVAVITTLNATYLWGTKSLIAIAGDGFFPEGIAAVNRRFGTPHWLLTIIFAISSGSLVLIGSRVEIFAIFASVGGILIFLPVMGASLRLRSAEPRLYEAARFKLSGPWYYIAPVVGILMSLLIIVILFVDLFSYETGWIWFCIFAAWMALGGIYAGTRRKKS